MAAFVAPPFMASLGMDYSTPWALTLRSAASRIIRSFPILDRLRPSQYEDSFGKAMLSHLQTGDTVWDIGANVGLYTRQFAEAVGPAGLVTAFEPSPASFTKLRANTEHVSNVTAIPVALSNFSGTSTFYADPDGRPGDGFDKFIETALPIEIQVRRGDDIEGFPTFIKIDVEGFEHEVLLGMPRKLRRARAVFLEVHFAKLNSRGLTKAPAQIVALLKESGFTVQWTDASHLAALRRK